MKMVCGGCGLEIQIVDKVGFRQSCEACGAWLHSCVHCRFWSGSICTETAAERIGNPEAQNYCELFQEKTADSSGAGAKTGGKEAAEEMWRKLTKK